MLLPSSSLTSLPPVLAPLSLSPLLSPPFLLSPHLSFPRALITYGMDPMSDTEEVSDISNRNVHVAMHHNDLQCITVQYYAHLPSPIYMCRHDTFNIAVTGTVALTAHRITLQCVTLHPIS